MRRSTKALLLGILAGCGLAALSQAYLNRAYRDRCHWDGTAIQPIFKVEWTAGKAGAVSHRFCCICCARSWMGATKVRQGRFSVRDEVSGLPMDALSGYYVLSASATEAATGCRIHVFREPLQARAHLLKHDGRPLPCPLQVPQDPADNSQQPGSR